MTRFDRLAYRTGLTTFYVAVPLLLAGVVTGFASTTTVIALAASAVAGGLLAHRIAPRALNQPYATCGGRNHAGHA